MTPTDARRIRLVSAGVVASYILEISRAALEPATPLRDAQYDAAPIASARSGR